MIKTCKQCGKEFETTNKTRCCSTDCERNYKKEYNKQWRKANPEKQREIEKGVREKRLSNGKAKEYRDKRRATKEGYIDRFLERARERTPDTDLDREFLHECMKENCCQVTGVPFEYERNRKTSRANPFAPSIDRVDSSVGYYKNNVAVVLVTVNLAKSEMSMEDFTMIWKQISKSWPALTGGEK